LLNCLVCIVYITFFIMIYLLGYFGLILAIALGCVLGKVFCFYLFES